MDAMNTATTATYFVVVDSAAAMPNSCWGRYRHVAVLECAVGYTPRRIDDRPKAVVRIVERWGPANVGRTKRCAYERALAAARALAARLNAGG